tara:strand:+ start:1393 stop:1569 length:177 start_codon:yes stop_codon:yes gene_type:complete
MSILHPVQLTKDELNVIAELVNDAVAYLPDPEDQPQPGSFADVVQKLAAKFPLSKVDS